MNAKRPLFITVTVLLVAVIVAISALTLAQGPRTSSVNLISRTGTTAEVDDLWEGKMSIRYYDNVNQSNYGPEDFSEENGVISYVGSGKSYVGISVNEKKGDIDWQQVADSGNIDFVMIRVGLREKIKGRIRIDQKFEDNIKGATEAGLPVGVFFYPKAVEDAEAKEEATFVLEKIRDYTVTYPIGIFWEYDLKDDGSQDETSRTVQRNGDQVTGYIDTFCNIINVAGFTPCYFAEKGMAYNRLDLSRLAGYDLWYGEYRPSPSFFYDFKIWQYTEEGRVPGIPEPVPVNISLKSYSK